MLLAVVLAALLLNQAVNSRVALLEERVSVMGMDKTFEGFTDVYKRQAKRQEHGNLLKHRHCFARLPTLIQTTSWFLKIRPEKENIFLWDFSQRTLLLSLIHI